MKILIYGTGGVGGYFGVRLAEVGNDVTFIARGKHLEAIQKNGLQLKSIDGDCLIFPCKTTNDISTLNSDFDLIIIGVKSWQILDAAKAIKPILNENTLVLPLQNGVSNVENLLLVLDKKHIIAGFCKIYAKVEDYGVINHFGFPPELQVGEINNEKSDRVLTIESAFKNAKFKTVVPDDIIADIWKKFMFICTVSGLGALTRVSIGAMVENEKTLNLLKKTVEEIYAVAIAKDINLPENMVKLMMSFIANQSYDSTASTQRDIMEGRPSELENFNGYIVKQGEKMGIETPVNQFVYSCLLPQELIARGVK
ncbi:MAG: 2-dehydropantoate 2-reductase [Urechidicola sp.]|nr:2-dehydropantoate 2-reductase [Urechidicola sp.]